MKTPANSPFQVLVCLSKIRLHWVTISGDTEGVVSILGGCAEVQRGGSICGGVDEGP